MIILSPETWKKIRILDTEACIDVNQAISNYIDFMICEVDKENKEVAEVVATMRSNRQVH